ncbi:MAG: T9SS type A sorting domain-containing protein [Bacteroidota bacterium]
MKKHVLIILMFACANFSTKAQWIQTNYPAFSPTCITNDGSNIFVGDTLGKVFLSTDRGSTWSDVSIGLPSTNQISCLAISDTIVLAGTSDSGMYKSTNNGLSWNHVTGGLPTAGQIVSIAVGGTTIYAVTQLGFYFSIDGGETWTHATGLFYGGTPSAIITNGPNVILATVSFSGGGLLMSNNNGTSWNFLVGDNFYSLASSDSIVLAGVRGSSYGVHRSLDHGYNWNYYNSSFPNDPYLYTLAVAISGVYLFAGTNGTGIYFSTDYGSSWITDNVGITYSSPVVQSLNVMDTILFAGMQGGLWKRTLSDFPPFATFSKTNVDCNGSSSGSITVTANGGTAPFQYSNDAGNNFQSGNVFNGLSAGTYPIIIKDGNNHFSDTIIVSITQPQPLNVTNASVINADCNVNNGSISAIVDGGVAPYSYLWNNGDTNIINHNINAGQYSCTVTDANGCTAFSSLGTVATNVLNTIPICMVTVDSLSTHNIVVWEKSALPASIDSFRIYRETMTNVYVCIGSVSNDSLSEYHDYGSNPNSTSFKYKLRAIDICGDTTIGLSKFHNTIHLQYLGNGNLIWTLYQIESSGNPVIFYIVNRDDNNTGNFLPISSTIPGTNSSYTDVNYASYPNARYRVDVSWSISCSPTRSLLTTTHSNIINNNTTVSVSKLVKENGVTIYPNPFTSSTTISFNELQKNTTIKITDILGKEIKTINYTGRQLVMDKGEMQSGIYFVQITDEQKHIYNRKIIIQ